MFVVGLTGGIGSGKSAVASLFTKRNVPIIDADIIARTVTQPGQPAFHRIVEHFGAELILPNGTLDRARLRVTIFSEPKERLWLEHLLHPLIQKAIENEINKQTGPYCIAVIPLLLEVESYPFIDRILVVDAPETAQIRRVTERDNVSKTQIEAILKTQVSRESRLARADDIILNKGTLAELEPQVAALHKMYLTMAK